MNENARAAFIIAQAAMLNAEIAMMQAENKFRESTGRGIAYGEEEMQKVYDNYSAVLGHNSCLDYLQS